MLPKEKLRQQFDKIVEEVESYYSSDLIFNLIHNYYEELFIQNKIIKPEELYHKVKEVENILQVIDKTKFPKDSQILKNTRNFLLYWNGNLKLSAKFNWNFNLN